MNLFAEDHAQSDIAYGDGFARLTEQETWNNNQNYGDYQKKRNKGDCKQQ